MKKKTLSLRKSTNINVVQASKRLNSEKLGSFHKLNQVKQLVDRFGAFPQAWRFFIFLSIGGFRLIFLEPLRLYISKHFWDGFASKARSFYSIPSIILGYFILSISFLTILSIIISLLLEISTHLFDDKPCGAVYVFGWFILARPSM